MTVVRTACKADVPSYFRTVYCVQFSPDGKYVAVGCEHVLLFNVETGIEQRYDSAVNAYHFFIDGFII